MRKLAILLVPAGVVLGHLAAYRIAHPDQHAREEALAGHGHFPALALAALVLAAGALCWAAVGERRGQPVRLDWGRLAIWQLTGFIVLEVVERTALGAGALAVLAEPALWAGAAGQAGAAALLVLLVRWAPSFARALLVGAPSLAPLPAAPGWNRSTPGHVAPSLAARRTPSAPRAPPHLLAVA